jgi:hypothetical protein
MLLSVVALDIPRKKTDITLINFTRDLKTLVNPTSAKLPLDQPYPFDLIHLSNSQSPSRVFLSDEMSAKRGALPGFRTQVILANEVPSFSLGNIYKKYPRRRSQYT